VAAETHKDREMKLQQMEVELQLKLCPYITRRDYIKNDKTRFDDFCRHFLRYLK